LSGAKDLPIGRRLDSDPSDGSSLDMTSLKYMPTKKDTKDIDVAKGFKELEDIAAWFERGETDLDAGLQKFERAMAVADALKKRLALAENKVREIKKKYE